MGNAFDCQQVEKGSPVTKRLGVPPNSRDNSRDTITPPPQPVKDSPPTTPTKMITNTNTNTKETKPKPKPSNELGTLLFFWLLMAAAGTICWKKAIPSTPKPVSDLTKDTITGLRDTSYFQWYVIPLFVMVVHKYTAEISVGNWNKVFGGLAFLGMDCNNELINAIFQKKHNSAFWTTPLKGSALTILIGWNIEIILMFSVLGLAFLNLLPKDKHLRILGLPNRWVLSILCSISAVIIEIWLNHIGVLVWEWSWWSKESPIPIFVFGYFHFFVTAFLVHDLDNRRLQTFLVLLIYSSAASIAYYFRNEIA